MANVVKFRNYAKTLKTTENTMPEQLHIYWGKINNNVQLKGLTGAQMACIAELMAEEKDYGVNECYKEFKD